MRPADKLRCPLMAAPIGSGRNAVAASREPPWPPLDRPHACATVMRYCIALIFQMQRSIGRHTAQRGFSGCRRAGQTPVQCAETAVRWAVCCSMLAGILCLRITQSGERQHISTILQNAVRGRSRHRQLHWRGGSMGHSGIRWACQRASEQEQSCAEGVRRAARTRAAEFLQNSAQGFGHSEQRCGARTSSSS